MKLMGIKMSILLNPGTFFSAKFGKLICQECYDQLLCSDYCCVQAGWEKKPEPQTRSECPEMPEMAIFGFKDGKHPPCLSFYLGPV